MSNSIDDLLNYWPLFTKYDEYANFKKYPTVVLKETLQYFGSVMTTVTAQPVNKWRLADISQGLTMIAEAAEEDDDSDALNILILTYDLVAAYLRCLVDNQIVKVSLDDLEDYLINFEIKYDLQGPVLDPEVLMSSQEVEQGANLPTWREYVARNILDYANDWLQAYFESNEWQHRETRITRELMTFIFTTLVSKAYDNYRKTPKSWTKKAIAGVLTGYFVANTDLTLGDYQLVAPALMEFLAFVADQGWLKPKRASDYQRFIASAAPEMVTRSMNPHNAGPGKVVGTALAEQGIDINDRAAVQRFINQVNDNGGLDSLYDDEPLVDDDTTAIPDDLMALLDNPQQLAGVAELYDPDPNQDYLTDSHQTSAAGWRKTTAIKTHRLAVETGIRLWLERHKYTISKHWESADLVLAVVDFVDVLYAQNLVTPSQWTVAVFKEVGQWFKRTQDINEYQDMQLVVAGVVDVLRTTEVLTKKQAGQLPAAFNGDVIPTISKPKKVTGKVMSIKQARKLLRNKKRR